MYENNHDNVPAANECPVTTKNEADISQENDGPAMDQNGNLDHDTVLEKEGAKIKAESEKADCETPERRKNTRKKVDLSGGYIVDDSGERGLIKLVDVSFSGLRFKMNSMRFLYNQAMMLIKFTLDTFPKTVISRQVIIRNLNGPYIGAEFCDPDQYDGFSLYLKKIEE